MKKSELNWVENYKELLDYVKCNGQLPNKKKVENRRLLNWWKYNRKLIKAGKLAEDRAQLLEQLGNMRNVCQSKILKDGSIN